MAVTWWKSRHGHGGIYVKDPFRVASIGSQNIMVLFSTSTLPKSPLQWCNQTVVQYGYSTFRLSYIIVCFLNTLRTSMFGSVKTLKN